LSLTDIAAQTPMVKNVLDDPTIGHTAAAKLCETTEASVRRYRKRSGWEAAETPTTPVDSDAPRARGRSAEADADGITLYSGPLDEPITAETGWHPVMRLLGIGDPEDFFVVEDTVRMSTWQQSARSEAGDRDSVQLYAYSCRVKRKSAEIKLAESELDEAVKRMRIRKQTLRRTPGTGLGEPVGYIHHQGDEQAGKSQGGGIDALESRELEVLERSLETVKYWMKKGVNVERIMDNAAGDRVENIFGHYPSQSRTVDTLRKQKDYATESDIIRCEAFAELGLPIDKVYTPSNHGEMRQVIGQAPYTSESDNFDLIIAEDVQRVIRRSAIADQFTWHIPHDEWLVTLEFMGVNFGASHGHKADGKNLAKWVKDQRDLYNFHHDFKMRVLLLGHKHHFHIEDISGTMLVQTSTLDAGSPYFEAGTGSKAIGGALGMLSGAHMKTGFDMVTFL